MYEISIGELLENQRKEKDIPNLWFVEVFAVLLRCLDMRMD